MLTNKIFPLRGAASQLAIAADKNDAAPATVTGLNIKIAQVAVSLFTKNPEASAKQAGE